MKKKYSIVLILSLIVFILVQTAYYTEMYVGGWYMPTVFFLFFMYAGLCIALVYQFVLLVKESFRDKKHLACVLLITILLGFIAYAPNGLINFELLDGEDLLVADAEGAANCRTIFKLKSDGTFKERCICFGVTVVKGRYVIKNDTIIFSDVKLGRGEENYYTKAVIAKTNLTNKKIIGELLRYENNIDTIPSVLYVIKNELKK